MEDINRDKLLSGLSIFKISWGEPKTGFSYTKGQIFPITRLINNDKKRIEAEVSEIFFDENAFYFYGKMIFVIMVKVNDLNFAWRSVVDIPVDIIYEIPNV